MELTRDHRRSETMCTARKIVLSAATVMVPAKFVLQGKSQVLQSRHA